MTPQMESNQPVYEQPSAAYGAYEGIRGSSQQQYGTPYQQPPQRGAFDDNFVEAVAQRLAQHMSQDTPGKVREKSDRLSASQRTSIAIVSIVFSILAIIPLGIVLGQQGLGGLIALGIICTTIFLVNGVIHGTLHSGK